LHIYLINLSNIKKTLASIAYIEHKSQSHSESNLKVIFI